MIYQQEEGLSTYMSGSGCYLTRACPMRRRCLPYLQSSIFGSWLEGRDVVTEATKLEARRRPCRVVTCARVNDEDAYWGCVGTSGLQALSLTPRDDVSRCWAYRTSSVATQQTRACSLPSRCGGFASNLLRYRMFSVIESSDRSGCWVTTVVEVVNVGPAQDVKTDCNGCRAHRGTATAPPL